MILECLENTLTVTSTPRVTTRVAKPVWVSLRMRPSKMSQTSSGRPMPRWSWTSASKNARARAGASSTRVRETSIWRSTAPTRSPPPGSLAVSGSGMRPSARRHPDRAGAQPVADALHLGGIVAGGEPVGELGEPQALLGRLPFGPLVAVDPDHDRVGEVTAQLDEPGADLVIPHLEEVAAHPPFGLLEPVPGWARLAVVAPSVLAAEHPLELLPHPDRDHPGPPGGLGGVQVGRITSALPCSLAKRTTGMPLALAKRATAARNGPRSG